MWLSLNIYQNIPTLLHQTVLAKIYQLSPIIGDKREFLCQNENRLTSISYSCSYHRLVTNMINAEKYGLKRTCIPLKLSKNYSILPNHIRQHITIDNRPNYGRLRSRFKSLCISKSVSSKWGTSEYFEA